MTLNIEVAVDRDNSVDPSYIVHYRVTDNGRLVGDGTVEYHRLAENNDIPIHPGIPRALREELAGRIKETAVDYINQRR